MMSLNNLAVTKLLNGNIKEAIHNLEKAIYKKPEKINHVMIYNLVNLYNLFTVKKKEKKDLLLVSVFSPYINY